MRISSEELPTRDVNEKVTGGIVNKRTSKTWEKSATKVNNLYSVIRKRTGHLATEKERGWFVCHISFTMTINKYKEKYQNAAKCSPIPLQNRLHRFEWFYST